MCTFMMAGDLGREIVERGYVSHTHLHCGASLELFIHQQALCLASQGARALGSVSLGRRLMHYGKHAVTLPSPR